MHQYTIDQGLEAVGFGRFQWLLLLLSGIGFFATTVELISLALLAEPLLKYWPQLSSHQLAYLASSTFAGELVGGLAWGSVSDLLGRRWVFLGTAMGAAVTGVLGAMAPCFYSLALTRFLLGISIGGCLSIDFVYFVEFVPVQSRGFRSTFIILLGILACRSTWSPLIPLIISSLLHFADRLASLPYVPSQRDRTAKMAIVRVWLCCPVCAPLPGPDRMAMGVATILADSREDAPGQTGAAGHGEVERNSSPSW